MKKPGLRDEVCPSRVGIKVASGIPRFFRRSPAYETIQTFLGRVSSILRVRVDVRPDGLGVAYGKHRRLGERPERSRDFVGQTHARQHRDKRQGGSRKRQQWRLSVPATDSGRVFAKRGSRRLQEARYGRHRRGSRPDHAR